MYFWVDNRPVHLTMQHNTQTAAFGAGKTFYLILNLALGGTWDVAPPSDMSPQRMYVDYVRYYQL
jgi:beta-glucanase (GH16 family)